MPLYLVCYERIAERVQDEYQFLARFVEDPDISYNPDDPEANYRLAVQLVGTEPGPVPDPIGPIYNHPGNYVRLLYRSVEAIAIARIMPECVGVYQLDDDWTWFYTPINHHPEAQDLDECDYWSLISPYFVDESKGGTRFFA